jgi:TPP-dependent pyruvate/acetoin dehydrogenase alpha subunit
MNTEQLIAFETKIAELWEAGELPYLLHLSGGNESQLLSIFAHVGPDDWIFSTHRNHYHALLAGIDPTSLQRTICDGRSMFVFDRSKHFFTSAILAGTCAIAAGVAYSIKDRKANNRVWCFIGDGGEEQGHFYEAVMFVQAHDLPCKFIIEDNDRAVDSSVMERTKGFRMRWPSCVERYCYHPTYPHAGNGTKKKIEFKL